MLNRDEMIPISNIAHPLGNSRSKLAGRMLGVATLDATQ